MYLYLNEEPNIPIAAINVIIRAFTHANILFFVEDELSKNTLFELKSIITPYN